MTDQENRRSTLGQRHAGGWTEERVALLKQMWGDNKSAQQCADALGLGATRNVVIGKVHRLHLPKRLIDYRQPRGPRGPRPKPKPGHRVSTMPRLRVFKERPPQPIGDAWLALDGTTPVALEDLAQGQCKWPIGDHPFLFCAAPAVGPYCEHHRLWSVGKGTVSERTALGEAKWAAERENVAEAA